ncbi:MAG: single-stranded DNA-binding protein [Leptospiraceae bacterium]|nr:single-stranded DNA-binding protein [Leptospiraceae bacterium]MCP5512743.1 single-stranded DNA-binding protein [Leptospiraceae bacterium]
MKNMAYTILDGNLTADPEIKKLNSGRSVTTFSIAINHQGKSEDAEDVSFIEVETWEKLAENCAEFLKKGRMVTVIGTLKQERWKTQEGSSRQKFKVIASSVRFDNFGEKNRKEEGGKKAA